MRGRKDLVLRKREERIVQTARRLFLNKGYEQSTVLEIARACDVAVGTVYKHFSSKEQLLIGVLDHQMRRLLRAVKRAVREHSDPLDQLRIYATLKWRLITQNRLLFEQELKNLAILLGSQLSTFETNQRRQEAFLRELAGRMIEANQLKAGSIILYAHIMAALIDGYIQSALEQKIDHRFDQELCQTLLQGAGNRK
jgi:AcrR family transcriptional regulator